MSATESLTFNVAPNIVEDLGLNLYTSLPRVLVELVANTHDADSPTAKISVDLDKVDAARKKLKADWEYENKKRALGSPELPPLSEMTLPEELQIVVEDQGCGMSKDDLQEKYLIVGRRRREEEKTSRTPKNRILMGRKGLGKLAGFGVAHKITILSRTAAAAETSEITLDFDVLVAKRKSTEVAIPYRSLKEGISAPGTRIILSKLVYGPMGSKPETIASHIADHFAIIDKDDFSISYNGATITATPRTFVFAYPGPEIATNNLVSHTFKTEEGLEFTFTYRIRFTGEGEHLQARERGMRIYAHKRLASVPDLLDLATGIHGFRNTHYMDGIVYADFIDDQKTDYIATDRQTLRWDSPLLTPMRNILTDQMKAACNAYQDKRDKDYKDKVKDDDFTKALIEAAELPKHRQRLAYRMAGLLAPACENGLTGKEYQQNLGILVDGLGQGTILTALAKIAASANPSIQKLTATLTDLMSREFGDFTRFVQGRLNGIAALRKLVQSIDFAKEKNEDALHALFKRLPWLIDPTFTQFLSSNEAESTLVERLAKELEIDKFVPASYDKNTKDEQEPDGKNKRPDLTYVLANESLSRVIVIELKAPNTPLHGDHLTQLENYINDVENWLVQWNRTGFKVEGYLIGTMPKPDSKAEKVKWLRNRIKEQGPNTKWRVFDLMEVLDRTEKAHNDLLVSYKRAAQADDENPSND